MQEEDASAQMEDKWAAPRDIDNAESTKKERRSDDHQALQWWKAEAGVKKKWGEGRGRSCG